MNEEINNQNSTEQAVNYSDLLPAVFTINTYYGSGKLTHLGDKDKFPFCGCKLQGAELSDTNVKVNKWGEVFEYWNQASSVQEPKWVKVASYNFCKKCLSVLNGRYRSTCML